ASGHIRTLAEIEAEAVDQAMARYSGAMSEAARRLGIGRSTLYRKTKGEEGGEHAE
ncbi:MAG: helix-turn-helix domain-containing protein, partial [Pseudomonadota bacterium]